MNDIHDSACASASTSSRQQFCVGKAFCQIEQDRRHLGEWSAVDDKHWHLAFRIEGKEGGRPQIVFERQRPALEWDADLMQRDVHRH
jgi:hypothetical protein